MRQCKHFIGAMRLHHLGSILSILLRMTVFSASVLGPMSANAADVKIDGAEIPVTAPAEDQSPPKSDATKAPSSKSRSSSTHGSTSSEQLAEVIVTGTRLNLKQSEVPQEVNVYTRQQIEQSGQTNLSGFLNTLPEVSTSFTEGAFQSMSGQTTVKLHGMPSGTTLLLVNGRRVQDSAITLGTSFASNFFDLNYIPLAAVDHIEVLPEGASAVYGSDAIAGVVNIILKKEFSGAAASARYSWAADLPQWDFDLEIGKQWEGAGFSLIGTFETRSLLNGFDREVTATQDHSAQGGLDTRVSYCPTPNIYGVNGANLPGLNAAYAAVPPGYTGKPSVAEFSGTAGILNQCSLYALSSTVPQTRRGGLFAQGYLDVNDSVQLFAEFLGSAVRQYFNYTPYPAFAIPQFQFFTASAANPYNPFGTTVGVGGIFAYAPLTYESDGSIIRPLLGLRGGFGSDWQWESTVVYSHDWESYTYTNSVVDRAAVETRFNSSDPAIAFNPFIDVPFDSPGFDSTAFHDYVQHYSASDLGVQGFARGTLFHFAGLPFQAVLGSEYHHSRLYTDNGNYANETLGPPGIPATYQRNSYAVFAESSIPILGNSTHPSEPMKLQATVAVRFDHFSDFGSTTNPQYGLQWRPIGGLLLSATYGDTFRAPPLYDLYSPVIHNYPNFLHDPQQNNQFVPVTILNGGNPNLQPETGSTHTLGLVYRSEAIPLDATVTQWRIEEKGNIQELPAQSLVNNPDIQPGSVVRDPSGALVLVNDTLLNFGTIDVQGVDFALKYNYRSPLGVWTPALAGTYTYRYQLCLTPSTPVVNAVSQAQDSGTWAPRWKGSASLGWAQGNLVTSGMARYVGSYADYDSARRIGDVWYFDLSAKYSWNRGALGTPFLEVGGVNIFNRLPQVSRYAFGDIGYDPSQADIRGRFLYVRVGDKF